MKSVLKDLTGKKFGMLTVIDRAPTRVTPNGTKQTYWWVQCDCGKELQCSTTNLLYRQRKSPISCGCYYEKYRLERLRTGQWRSDAIDLTGKRFGTRTVLKLVGHYKSKTRKWLWRCDCGREGTAPSMSLHKAKSCGCLNKKTEYKKPKHDWVDYHERMARVRGVRQKCKKKSPDYDLTDQEIHDFIYGECVYCGEIGSTKSSLGIDRVDPSLGYIKSNCVSACWTCNKVKSTMTLSELREHLQKMLSRLGEK